MYVPDFGFIWFTIHTKKTKFPKTFVFGNKYRKQATYKRKTMLSFWEFVERKNSLIESNGNLGMALSQEDQFNLRTIIDKLVDGDMAWMAQKDIKVGDKGNFWILNYGMKGKNEFNRLVRGMVVQKPNGKINGDKLQLIKSFPFIRFFNQGEPQADAINVQNSELLEKLDGCFDGNTKISFCDGTKVRIKDVVDKKMKGPVWGFDHSSGEVVPSEITFWHDNGLSDDWVTVRLLDKNNGNGVKNIMCTPNHLFWNEDKYTPANEMNAKSTVSRLRNNLNHVQKSVVLGTLLGDSSILNDGGWCIAWSHVKDQDCLSQLICDTLKPLHAYSQTFLREDSFSKKPKVRYNIHGTEVLEPIAKICVKNNKKTVSEKWLNELDEIALAIWYMDDGSLSKGSGNQRPRAILHTEGFDENEINLILNYFKNIHGFNPSINKYRGYQAIRLNANDAEVFWNKISPYMLRHFDYKTPDSFAKKVRFWDNYENDGFGKRLKPMDVISVNNGNYKISHNGTQTRKYDITTNTSNFFANDILVHNSMVGVFFPENDPAKPQWHTRNMLSTHQPDLDLEIGGFGGGNNKLMSVIGEYVRKLHFNEEDTIHTYVFEFIHQASTVLTRYKEDKWGLHLLAARRLTDYKEEPESEVDKIAQRIGAERPQRWDAVEHEAEIEAMMTKMAAEIENFEGFVFRDRKTGKRLKLKDAGYVSKHHMLGDISYKRLVPKVLDGEEDEIISYFPHAKKLVDEIKSKHEAYVEKAVAAIKKYKKMELPRKELWNKVSDGVKGKMIQGMVMRNINLETDEEMRNAVEKELRTVAVVSFEKETYAGLQTFQIASGKYLKAIGIKDED